MLFVESIEEQQGEAQSCNIWSETGLGSALGNESTISFLAGNLEKHYLFLLPNDITLDS